MLRSIRGWTVDRSLSLIVMILYVLLVSLILVADVLAKSSMNDDGSITTTNFIYLRVPHGGMVHLDSQDLNNVNPFNHFSESCKVEVITKEKEPVTQRFGRMKPPVFDCNFTLGLVFYEHFGIRPAKISEDRVKLRFVDFSGNITKLHETEIIVVLTEPDVTKGIIRNRRQSIATVKGSLVVNEFFGLSRPIDHRVLEFHIDNTWTINCRVRLRLDGGWPRHGRMVSGISDRRLIVNDETISSCDEFLYTGFRYEHLRPPTPNVDYVGLLVEAEEEGIQRREWIQLTVNIKPALPNVPPRLSDRCSLNFKVHQDIPGSFLTTNVLSAEDDESPPSLIVFNLTKGFSPYQGYLYRVDDNSRRVLTSFTQDDLLKKNIAYSPPTILYFDRLRFQIRFDILDGDFEMSPTPATINVDLHRQDNSTRTPMINRRPRISVKMGLMVIEGSSRPLQVDQHLILTMSTSPYSVRIVVVVGPKHGRLLVDGVYINSEVFTWNQLERELVIYEHDGSDATNDSIHLNVFGDPDVLKVVLPIDVLPQDDSSPQLIVNEEFRVVVGEIFPITSNKLRAVDSDSKDAEITYFISEAPRHGNIFKHWSSSTLVSNFTQTDIDDGLLFYRYDGNGGSRSHENKRNFPHFDNFEIRLHDGHHPPNRSPSFTIHVKIESRSIATDNMLRALPSSSNQRYGSVSVLETEFLVLDDQKLHYLRRDGRAADVTYDVTGCYALDGNQDGGKLVLIGNNRSNKKSELARLPEVKSFSQHQVNGRRIVYVPPTRDVGPTLLRVVIHFSVRDRHGVGHLPLQQYNITVFPVDNKPPVLYTGLLVVPNGGSSVISTHALSVIDDDTPIEDLLITLNQIPNYGTVFVDHIPLVIGHNFTITDVAHSRINYAHRGVMSTSDRIHLAVSDGVHSVVGSILVHLVPSRADNNQPTNEEITEEKEGLTINEGDDIIITPEVLIGDVFEEVLDQARFFVVQNANLGSIQVKGKSSDAFTQEDLVLGHVKYVQNGSVEIGRSSQLDDIHFILVGSDTPTSRVTQQGRSGGFDENSVQTLRITILPVDNSAPRLELGPDTPLRVPEGASVPISRHVLDAVDLDSKEEDVALVIAKPPEYGHLASIKLDRSGLDVRNRPILSFRLGDLEEETIHYVQSVHDYGSEPIADSFDVYATDGKHRSRLVTLNVLVVPLNDESPVISLRNFTVIQRGEKILDESVLNVSDADRPFDRILVRLHSRPNNGRIIVETKEGSEQDFSELDWSDSKFVSIIYRHEGSATRMDNFTLLVSDGVHMVTQTAFVKITSHENRSPHIVTNKGLRDVVIGDFRFISNTVLNADTGIAKPGRHRPVRYLLKRVPRHGVLQLFRSALSWTNVTSGDTFTQQDIDSLSLRYVHNGENLESINDDFGFVVFVGDVHPNPNAQTETFLIEMKSDRSSEEFLEVNVGGRIILGPDGIRPDVLNRNPDDVIFMVLIPPEYGRVIRMPYTDVSILNFTLTDINRQLIEYIHSGETIVLQDRIRISVISGGETISPTNIVDVVLRIYSPAVKTRTTSTTTTTTTMSTTQDSMMNQFGEQLVVPATVGIVNLKTMKFRAIDSDAIYSLIDEPDFGSLLLDGRPLTSSSSSFAQRHVDDGRVAYKRHPHVGLNSDVIHFRVVSVTPSDRPYKQLTKTQDISVIVVVDQTTPFEILPKIKLISPEILENFNGDLQGFLFSDDNINYNVSSVDGSLRTPQRQYRYLVKSPPKYGRLERISEFFRSAPPSEIREFTQRDVSKGLIRYVLSQDDVVKDGSTGDDFVLSLLDATNGVDVFTDASMELRWALVYFMQTEYNVCEDVGKFSLPVKRSPNLDGVSSVGIGVIVGDGTARHPYDYGLSRTRIIEFDEGVDSVDWDINITNDGVDEDDVETMVIKLKNPENAVIYGGGKITINIYDKKKDSCLQLMGVQQQNSSSSKSPTMAPQITPISGVGVSPVCNWQTIGTPLSITIGSSTITLVCDGKTWVSSATPSTTTSTTVAPVIRNKSIALRDKTINNPKLGSTNTKKSRIAKLNQHS